MTDRQIYMRKYLKEYLKIPKNRIRHRKNCKAWRIRNPKKYKALQLQWKQGTGKGYHRRYNLQHKYGITTAQFSRMERDQGGRCAICKKHPKQLHVDHCHTSGQVRGLLCLKCNTGIGNLQESITLFRKAITYLKKYQLMKELKQ